MTDVDVRRDGRLNGSGRSRPLAALLLPLVALIWSGWLLVSDPSDASYDCPASAWTLLIAPAPPGPGPAEFFDAGAACNDAARRTARTAITIQASALLLSVALTAAQAIAGSRRQSP